MNNENALIVAIINNALFQPILTLILFAATKIYSLADFTASSEYDQ